jgi:hypothetical protein
MYFDNVDKIPLFDAFLERYKDRINEILEENESNGSKVVIFSSNHPVAQFYIIAPTDFIVSQKDAIAYNEKNCDSINLTIQERYAFIAHEIGHIFDTTDKSNKWQREVNADSMACKIGLQDFLISGLKKMIDSHTHIEMEVQMQKRIDFLLSQNDHQGTENEC